MGMEMANYADADGGKTATIKNPFGNNLDLELKHGGDGSGKFSDDSSWNIAADWSTCTVACGGGT